MKKTLIIIACMVVAAAGIGFWRLQAPFRVIQTLDVRYQQVQRGRTTNQVQVTMNYPGRWQSNGVYRGWDDKPASSQVPRIGWTVAYSVPTFFLGVTFEFTFDESGKAVGKHRLD